MGDGNKGNDGLSCLVNLLLATGNGDDVDAVLGGVLGGELDRHAEVVLQLKTHFNTGLILQTTKFYEQNCDNLPTL